MKIVAAALASLLALATVARADDAPYAGPPGAAPPPAELGVPADYRQGPARPRRAHQRGAQGPVRAAVLQQFDRDGDGRLSPQERRHAARALRRMARQMAKGARRGGPQGRGEPQVDVDVRW